MWCPHYFIIIRFVKLGNINEHLIALEKQAEGDKVHEGSGPEKVFPAKSMLVFVKDYSANLLFPMHSFHVLLSQVSCCIILFGKLWVSWNGTGVWWVICKLYFIIRIWVVMIFYIKYQILIQMMAETFSSYQTLHA